MRAAEGHVPRRCAAVVKYVRNAEEVNVVCRDEAEVQQVKQAA